MMMKNSFFVKKLNLLLLIIFLSNTVIYAASDSSNSRWILAAENFTYKNNQKDSISNAIATIMPSRILDNMGNSLYRNITAIEQYERESNSLKTERISLFLQLSSEIKKRDNLVVGNYSEKELKNKIKLEEEKIQEIRDKISENLEQQKKLLEKYENPEVNNQHFKKDVPQTERDKYANLLKNIIYADSEEVINEKISLYKDDSNSLYKKSEIAKTEGYTSTFMDKEMQSAKINGLLTGEITAYSDFLFVSVTLYVYPGAQLITTVSEVGTIDEMDFISESLARQLIPSLTNSMPITISVNIQPEEAYKNAKMYIDDTLVQNLSTLIHLDSGVHFIQFTSDNFKSLGTTYYFTGNTNYQIDVNMENSIKGEVYITNSPEYSEETFAKKISNFMFQNSTYYNGSFYVDGIETSKVEEDKAKIKINGNTILGQFIAENGENSFFYIPENIIAANELLYVSGNAFNRDEYIEKHRRKMYNAYGCLVVSLIPYFISKGQYESYLTRNDPRSGIWNGVKIGFASISIGCGVWMVYELVRYFMAADSVIPEKAKVVESNYIVKETVNNSEIIETIDEEVK